MVADLPTELIRETLKYIRGPSWDIPSHHKKHLKITSLVSSTFRKISQEFLFEKLELGLMPRCLQHPGHDIYQGAKLLSVFTTSPKLATHVKYIDLNDFYFNATAKWWLSADQDIAQALRYIPLHRIIAFRFRSFKRRWDSLAGETQDVILSICSSPCLKSLEVDGTFLKVLDACSPSLNDLKVYEPDHEPQILSLVVPEERQQGANKLRLERLEINSLSPVRGAIHTVLDPSNRIETSRLKLLTISAGVHHYDSEAIGQLLESCTSSLESFIYRKFYHRPDYLNFNDPHPFELSRLSALKRFGCIYLNQGDTTSIPATSLSALLPLFHSLPSLSPLEVFHLRPCYDQRASLSQTANLAGLWDQFDALFADRQRFPSLRCVRITISYVSRDGASEEDNARYLKDIPQKIKSHLKRLTRAGILAVDVSLDYSEFHFGWPSASGIEDD
ncbi:hypothetical protein FA15DRAFT_672653 [Coprinopsis marcescibilis]|uniref:F-box domain-containing protein n=1 Tax=Coprinopsis marcescibilis TaxID=230819 RepID=A0A5C3KLS6_COPMA|nr:hypothetical protein FA15DRAFT_672653 [Coprinopsis marcescibilis]